LHEYVHSGDFQVHGKYTGGDGYYVPCLGTEFELATFGIDFNNLENVQDYVKPNNSVEKEPEDNIEQFNAFWQTIQGLPTGNYQVVNGQIVPVTIEN